MTRGVLLQIVGMAIEHGWSARDSLAVGKCKKCEEPVHSFELTRNRRELLAQDVVAAVEKAVMDAGVSNANPGRVALYDSEGRPLVVEN